MDPRLLDAFSNPVKPEQIFNLSVYAVQYARQDLGYPSTDDMLSDYLNVHLAGVLVQGFDPERKSSLVGWDKDKVQADLILPAGQTTRFIIARRIGNQALFIASQQTWSGHRRLAQWEQIGREVTHVGRISYLIASARVKDQKVFGVIFSDLGHQFEWYSELLGHAGILLGFTSSNPLLLHPERPIVTIDDFLEALAAYGRNPSHDNWALLRQVTADHHWIDPEFTFELPPEP